MSPDDPTGEFDLLQLKLAFAYHVVQQIVGADDQVAKGELRFLQTRFPADELRRCGFIGVDGAFTDAYHRATGEALMELPERLNDTEKYQMVDLLLEACLADDELHASEAKVLVHAARLLGIPNDALDAHLTTKRTMVGDIELTTQEWER